MSDENDLENNVPLEKTKTKIEKIVDKVVSTKKPRTEKQKAQFQQVMSKRQENIEKKKLEKKLEASKLLAEKDPEFFKQLHSKNDKKEQIVEVPTPVFEEQVKPIKKLKGKKEPTVIELDNTDEESEESVIIVKKKSKPKKKKKIIVEEPEESSSSSDEDVVQLPKPKRNFVSQQNRKSVIKIHDKPSVLAYESYFV